LFERVSRPGQSGVVVFRGLRLVGRMLAGPFLILVRFLSLPIVGLTLVPSLRGTPLMCTAAMLASTAVTLIIVFTVLVAAELASGFALRALCALCVRRKDRHMHALMLPTLGEHAAARRRRRGDRLTAATAFFCFGLGITAAHDRTNRHDDAPLLSTLYSFTITLLKMLNVSVTPSNYFL
jgi:hypothetical protein